MINQATIDAVLQAAKIEDVVKQYVQLKKSGVNFSGLCPFHNEKTPSFVVSPAKNIYHCFGCGAGGNAVKFLMEYEKLTFPEAIKKLADKYGISIEESKETPEQKKKQIQHKELLKFNRFIADFYKKNLYKPDNALALEYISSRFHQNTIEIFEIGYAPDKYNSIVMSAKNAGFSEELMLKSGFVKRNKKGELYDFFRNRIIFPVFDKIGNIISFSGRSLPWGEDKYAKYINGPETQIFSKRHNLFAFNFALRNIAKSKTTFLVEGNPDVIRLHEIGITNAVAPLGTALTTEQIETLKRFTDKIVMIYDGDNAGQNAAVKNGKSIIKQGLAAYTVTLPNNEDPDTFFKSQKQFNEFVELNKQDFIVFYAKQLFVKAGTDPMLKNESVKEIGELLFTLEKSKQNIYIEQIAKAVKAKAKLFSDYIKEKERENQPVKKDDDEVLPETVDATDFQKWGFYEYKNAYYFRTKEGIQKLSNFTMRPIFHVESAVESKRIYELANEYGYHAVIDFDMQEMTSIQAFQRNVEGKGNFLFWGTVSHFQKLKLKLYEETRSCKEIKNLGWQREGFWAWSNGKIDEDGNFVEIDEYGIITHNKQHYFIPAFSKIYINDKSVFIDERKFKFVNRDISLQKWSKLFIQVFGDNAKIGIAFWTAAIFRDYLLHIFKNFPILNLFGPKGTGKSQMAMSLSCLFGEQQTPFNIHNGTKPGLAEHLQLFRNAFAWVDEYKNNLEYDKIETLKAIYDAIGRSRMNISKGMKKETTEVNAAVILSGQEMPTIDVALFSRMIFLQFNKTEFSKEEKKLYEELKQLERDGLSHLTTQLLKYRKYFEQNFYENYESIMAEFAEDNKADNIEDRILRNMATIAAAFKTISEKLNFTFSYNELKEIAYKAIRDQNNQISKSNEVGMFWNLVEAMFDENILIEKWHFRIDFVDKLKLKTRTINFNEPKYVLKIKFNVIYKFYAQQSRLQGIKPLPSDTLQYYLSTAKYFYGIADKTNFSIVEKNLETAEWITKKQNTTAYCFDYEKLKINLQREQDSFNDINNEKHNGKSHPDAHTEATKYVELDNKDELPF